MTTTCHPFQKLCYVPQPDGIGLLLAANGPNILSVDLRKGLVASKWPDDTRRLPDVQDHEVSQAGGLGGTSREDDPPSKRRKLSPFRQYEQASSESSVSIEFVSQRLKGQRRKKKIDPEFALPNVSHLISTADGLHVIAVTAEDKCIRVFELDAVGSLKPLSERHGRICLSTRTVLTAV